MDSGELIGRNSYGISGNKVRGRRKLCVLERAVQRFTLEFKRKFILFKERIFSSDRREKFLDLIKLYETNEHFTHFSDIRRIVRWNLPIAIFESKVEDNWMVQEFLKFLDRSKNLSIDLFLMSVMNRCNLVHGETTDSSYLAFFLQHANQAKLTFGGHRLSQVLLDDHAEHRITTLLYSRPESVFTLLQYEARLFSTGDDWDDRCQRLFACAFEFILFCGITTKIWDENLVIENHRGDFSPYMTKMLLNFRLLLRIIPSPHGAILSLSGVRVGCHSVPIPPSQNLRDFFCNVYPGSDLASSKTPSLKHFCRITIRRRLYDNWQLPDGIYGLGLPELLQNYLNLYEE